jgi:hypothetical protein
VIGGVDFRTISWPVPLEIIHVFYNFVVHYVHLAELITLCSNYWQQESASTSRWYRFRWLATLSRLLVCACTSHAIWLFIIWHTCLILSIQYFVAFWFPGAFPRWIAWQFPMEPRKQNSKRVSGYIIVLMFSASLSHAKCLSIVSEHFFKKVL